MIYLTWRGLISDPTAQVTAQVVNAGGTTNIAGGKVGRQGDFWITNLPVADGTNKLTLFVTDAAGNTGSTNIAIVKTGPLFSIEYASWDSAAGTIGDTNYTVWVNGAKASLDGSGGWSAGNPQATLENPVVQARAIPNTDNNGSGSGAGTGSANPTSADAVDAEDVVAWQPHTYTVAQNLEYHDYAEVRDFPYVYSYDDSVNWTEEGGGTEFLGSFGYGYIGYEAETRITYPGDSLPQFTNGTAVEIEGLDVGATWSYTTPVVTWSPGWAVRAELSEAYTTLVEGLPETAQWTEQDSVTLVTGGEAGDTEPALYTISGGASGLLPDPTMWLPVGDWPLWTNVPPENVSIGSLGQLDTNGNLYVVLPARAVFEATPLVSGGGGGPGSSGGTAFTATAAWASPTRHGFLSETVATTPPDRSRTTIGVGEEVKVYFSPTPHFALTYTVQGAGSYWVGDEVLHYTAPSNACSVTITAAFPNGKLTKTFSVVEPTGVDHADFVEYGAANVQNGGAGVGVHLRPYVGPTNVSFYRVQVEEVGEDASGVSGYFATNTAPSHTGNGADAWIDLDYDNHWKDGYGVTYDWATSYGWQSPWSSGRYTWEIPARWKIGKGPTNSMTGWNQVITIDGSGTMTVGKFGHTITRAASGAYSGE